MRCLLFAAVAVAACARHEPAPPAHRDLELLGTGAEPRHLLHYALTKGVKSTYELAIDVGLQAGTMGSTMPTLALTLEMAIDDLLPDGRARLRTTVVDATARERPDSKVPAAALNAQLELLRGIAVSSTLSPDGKLTEVKAVPGNKPVPPALDQQIGTLIQSLQQITMPLPDQPVGPGAKWRSVRALQQNGLAITATSTVDLTAIDGTTITFATTTELTGADQTVTMQGTPIEVKHLHGTGTGKGTLDLATLVVSAELAQQFSADMASQGQDTAMKLDMKLTITPQGAHSAP